nr:arylsulfatase [Haloferax sp. Atlit-48N]
MENVILVSIDSLRADYCGFINPDEDTTPFLDGLAEESSVFKNAFTVGPRTPSAMPPIFTGEYYTYNDVRDVSDMGGRRQKIANHLSWTESIPELLQRKGYTTAAFTANPWTASDTNFDIGFDTFVEIYPGGEDGSQFLAKKSIPGIIDKSLKSIGHESAFGWKAKREWFSHWQHFIDYLSESIQELPEPYFVWIFLMDTHQPYLTPRSIREESSIVDNYWGTYKFWTNRGESQSKLTKRMISRSYRDAVRSFDKFMEVFLDSVPDDFSLVIHSDHGEALGENSIYGHEYQLFDHNIHVPLLVKSGDESETVESPVSLIQLKKMISDLAENSFDPSRYCSDYVVSRPESDVIADLRSDELGYSPHYLSVTSSEDKLLLTSDGPKFYTQYSQSEDSPANVSDDRIEPFIRTLEKHNLRFTEKQAIRSAISDLTQGNLI